MKVKARESGYTLPESVYTLFDKLAFNFTVLATLTEPLAAASGDNVATSRLSAPE